MQKINFICFLRLVAGTALLCWLMLPFVAHAQSTVSSGTYKGEAELTATDSIELTDGFEVPAGKSFTAYTTPNAAGCVILSSTFSNRNYVVTNTLRFPGITSLSGKTNCQVNQAIQYFDGLGRPLQTVQVQASPLGRDIIQPIAYDAFGREAVRYLPYASDSTNNGTYRSNAIAKQRAFYNSGTGWDASTVKTPSPFSVTVFEPSPLNRLLQQGAPGDAWQPLSDTISGSGHTVKADYRTNAALGDTAVRLWTAIPVATSGQQHKRTLATASFYAAGQLSVTISKDENWSSGRSGTAEEYKDKEGRIVLKRVWKDESTKYSTYYVYDDLGNLSFVLPPGASPDGGSISQTTLDAFCYQYRYDGRKRLIEKRVPGKGWEALVYNKLDQVVMSRDSVLKGNNKWLFTKYDALGRTVMTGIISSASDRSTWQTSTDAQGTLWESRDNANASAAGTGYTNAVLPTTSIDRYHTITYYDDYDFYNNTFGGTALGQSTSVRGLATGSRTNILESGTMLLSASYYDQEGRVVQSKSQNHLSGADTVVNTYGFTGELLTSSRNHTPGSEHTIIATRYEYDPWGRKKNTFEYINNQANEVKVSALEYNEVGQLKGKSLHNGIQSTAYAYNPRGWLKTSLSPQFSMELKYENGTTPQWNGNIANQVWGTSSPSGNTFTYLYDALNRLTKGVTADSTMRERLTYDAMGNIEKLERNGARGSYTYTGNQLTRVTGGWNTPADYAYDGNGNAITDGNNNKTLTYNILNLPKTVSGGVTYTYDATGNKLTKVNTTTGITTRYVNGIQYNGSAIDFIQTEEGKAVRDPANGNYQYEYNLTDHLGNIRKSFDIYAGAARVIQEDDYFPFGKRRVIDTGVNRYLYNGKELQEELGQYDYGARFYDPVIGRWNSVDPLAESYQGLSSYNYAMNDPVGKLDPNGMWVETAGRFSSESSEEAQTYFRQLQGGVDDDKKKKQNEKNGSRDEDRIRLTKQQQLDLGLRYYGGDYSGDWYDNLLTGVDALNQLNPIAALWDVFSGVSGNTDRLGNQQSTAETGLKFAGTLMPLKGIKMPSASWFFSANEGYGLFGKTGSFYGGYKLNFLYGNTTPNSGTIFSAKQMLEGGNTLRWDYGPLHGTNNQWGLHSTFRFNVGNTTYGSTKQYSWYAPILFFKHKQPF